MDLSGLDKALHASSIAKAAKDAVTGAVNSAAKAAASVMPHGLKQSGHAAATDDEKMKATAKVFQAVQGHWLSASLGVMLQLRIADILVEHATVATARQSAAAGVPSHKIDAESPSQSVTNMAHGSTGTTVAHADAPAGKHVDGSSSDTAAMSIDQIAAACGCTTATSRSHLYKVLRVLAQYEMLDEQPGKVFSPNAATYELVQGNSPSLGHMAAHLINKPKWDAWKVLPEAVQQGKTAFVVAHGMDVYQFGELPDQTAFHDEFCKAMSYFTRHSLTGGHTSLKDAYDWRSSRVILDVGGGRGELLSSVMSWAGGDCKGLILDRQPVIDSIDIPGMFESKGVTSAASRLTLTAGDVREPFPQVVKDAKVDTLLMKHFLSAFSDEDAVLIVKHCKQVLTADGCILLLQTLVPEAGDRSHNACEDGVAPGLFSIEILAQCPGGAWRTLSEWEDIFKQAGMELRMNTAVGCNMNLMVFKEIKN